MDWIVLHTNEKMESMVKGRIYPRALPNQGQDQSNELKFLIIPTGKPSTCVDWSLEAYKSWPGRDKDEGGWLSILM